MSNSNKNQNAQQWVDPTLLLQRLQAHDDGLTDDDAQAPSSETTTQEPAQAPAGTLPYQMYSMDGNDAKVRAMAGLMALQRDEDDAEGESDLLREMLSRVDLPPATADKLMERFLAMDTAQRQSSIKALENMMQEATLTYKADESIPTDVQLPTIAFEQDELGDWNATFALHAHSVRAMHYRINIEEASASFMLGTHHIQQTWQERIGLGVQVRFAWRIIAHEQRITLALLVRLQGATSQEDAQTAMHGIWEALGSALPARDVFDYRPVTDEAMLAWLRMPHDNIVSAYQIGRREDNFTFADKPVYMARPLGMNQGTRHAMLAELMRHQGVHVLDVQFNTTEWRQDERLAIQTMLHNRVNPNMSRPDANDPIGMMLTHMSDQRYLRALEHYKQVLGRDVLFEMAITVTSDQIIDQASLPVLVATHLFSTSHFEIRSAHLDSERDMAYNLLRDVTGRGWWRSNTPKGLQRLPRLWQPEEALAGARLPVPDPQGIPGLRVLNRKITPVPLHLSNSGVVLGDAYDPKLSRDVPIYLAQEERMRHGYVVGRTGTGKTTLLENMVVQDIHAGRGVGVIDPHGDLIENILKRIPPERAKDVILFDPSDRVRPIGLNIIDVETEYEQNMVIAEFIGLLYSMYDPGRIGILGPRFEQMMRNAMLVAMANEGTTLVDVMHIITNKDYLTRMLRAVKDPVVKTYWEELANNFKYERAEMLDYVTSKLNRFVGDIAVRGIVAQPQTTVDFAEIMNEGKILLVNLSKGKTGPEISRFLGLLVVPRLLITAFQRAHISEEERRPFFLYIDEFHNFTTPALATMLSEGRKYGLSLTLANQFISQLAPDIRESIFGNFGTMGVFQVGIRDAKLLEEEMYPVFDSDDLVNMPPYHVALKLPTAGTLSKPFLMQTRPSWAETHQPLAEAIRRHSRMIYGRDVAYNSAQIYRRFNDKD